MFRRPNPNRNENVPLTAEGIASTRRVYLSYLINIWRVEARRTETKKVSEENEKIDRTIFLV